MGEVPTGGHRTRLFTFVIADDVARICGHEFPNPYDAPAPPQIGLWGDYRAKTAPAQPYLDVSGPDQEVMPDPRTLPRVGPDCLGQCRDNRGRPGWVYDLHGILRAQTRHGEPPGGGTGAYLTSEGHVRTLMPYESMSVAHSWPFGIGLNPDPQLARDDLVNAWSAMSTYAALWALGTYLLPWMASDARPRSPRL